MTTAGYTIDKVCLVDIQIAHNKLNPKHIW